MTKIFLKFKDAVLKEMPIEKDLVTIGRKPENDVQIDNLAVSGFHAKIYKEGDGYIVEDLNSLNGTFVNGRKVLKQSLRDGDEILVGKHTIKFASTDAPAASEPTVVLKGRSMDETMVLDPKVQQEMLGKSSESKAAAAQKEVEVLGGFTIIEGSTDKKDYEITERMTTIGKEDGAGIKLKGFFAPKVAALVNRKKDGYFITPSSGKSIKINDKEFSDRQELKDGDIVEVASLKMQFYIKE